MQAELERPQSSYGELEKTDEEDEAEEEQEGRSKKPELRTQSSRLSLTQPVRNSLLLPMGQRDECRA